MITKESKLSPTIFKKDIDQSPIRSGFGEGLLLAAKENDDVVGLCADLADSTKMKAFAEKYPERFFEVGVAEQNLATVAAGLGISGKIPFMSSFATFSPGRNWEQIRSFIAYNDSNVKVVGSHSGVSVGPDGATHQATEDIAIMRVMPNMKVFVPCDAIEAKKITMAAAKIWGPCYIRLAREKTPIFTTENTPFAPGEAQIFWKGEKPKVAIIACGPIVYNALLAAREIAKMRTSGVHADTRCPGIIVINCPTIKPLDERTILKAVKECEVVVTVESHQIAGGLGGAIAELLAKHNPKPMAFVGLNDTFGESGSPSELIEKYGMDAEAIKKVVLHTLNVVSSC